MLISREALVPKVAALVSLDAVLTDEFVTRLIRSSLSMSMKRTPEEMLWELSRRFKRLELDHGLTYRKAKKIFGVWYHEACKVYRTMWWNKETQDYFEGYPGEFPSKLDGWCAVRAGMLKVKFPFGVCLENLIKKTHGQTVYDRLKSLMVVMDNYVQGGSFMVSSHAIAEAFSDAGYAVTQPTISRYLRWMVEQGDLEVTRESNYRGAICREYRLRKPKTLYFSGDVSHEDNQRPTFPIEQGSVDVLTMGKAGLEGKTDESFAFLREITLRRQREMGLLKE